MHMAFMYLCTHVQVNTTVCKSVDMQFDKLQTLFGYHQSSNV